MTIEKKKSRKKEVVPIWKQKLDGLIREVRLTPVSEEYIHNIVEGLMAWLEDENNYIWNAFLATLPHSRNQVYNWSREFPVLKKAIEHARIVLAVRREKKVAEDPKFAVVYNKTIGCYDFDYLDMVYDMERAKAKFKKDEESDRPVVIVLDKMPETNVVRIQKDEQ